MPKSTHQHQEDSLSTDKKYRPEDEHVYEHDKQEFQESEIEKKEAGPTGKPSTAEPRQEK